MSTESNATVNLSLKELETLLKSKNTQVLKSETIGELSKALAKLQSELVSAKKDSSGYGYNYSDLATVIETAKPLLAKNNLAVSQLLGNGESNRIKITTILSHSSGEYISSELEMDVPDMKNVNDAQKQGAAYSYGRRYALQGILNMASEDNDASSSGFSKKYEASKSAKIETSKKSFRNVVDTSEGDI